MAFFKRTTEALQALTAELRGIRQALEEHPADEALEARVDALELNVSQRLAEADAMLVKADSQFKAARASEERARHQAKRAEKAKEELAELDEEGMDPFEAAGQRWLLHQGNAEGGGDEGVQPVRDDVEVPASAEQVAARFKFGG